MMLTLSGCGTQKTALKQTAPPTAATTETAQSAVKTYHVDANPELVSVAEAIALYSDKSLVDQLQKKYKYKKVAPYGVYRLDKYDTMLYKNCRPARKMSDGVYEDTPLPQAKGTSSYVVVSDKVIVAVFNNKAWENLIEQIKGLGFVLTSEGHEDCYSNGTIEIYAYKARKSIRIEKSIY